MDAMLTFYMSTKSGFYVLCSCLPLALAFIALLLLTERGNSRCLVLVLRIVLACALVAWASETCVIWHVLSVWGTWRLRLMAYSATHAAVIAGPVAFLVSLLRGREKR